MEVLQRILTHDDCEIQLVKASSRSHGKWGGYVKLRIVKIPRDFVLKTVRQRGVIILDNGEEVNSRYTGQRSEYFKALERLEQTMQKLEEIADLNIEIVKASQSKAPTLHKQNRI